MAWDDDYSDYQPSDASLLQKYVNNPAIMSTLTKSAGPQPAAANNAPDNQNWDADYADYVPNNQTSAPQTNTPLPTIKQINQADDSVGSFLSELPRGLQTSGAGNLELLPPDIAHKIAIGSQYLTGNKEAAASIASMTPEQFQQSLQGVVNTARKEGEGTGIPGTLADIVTDPRNAAMAAIPEAGLLGRFAMGVLFGYTNPAADPKEASVQGRLLNGGLTGAVNAVAPGAIKLSGVAGRGLADLTVNSVQSLGNVLQKANPEGRAILAGKMLLNAADNPQAAMANLANPTQFVPGSTPLTAEVAQDAGLAKVQQAVQINPAMFPGGGAQIENALSQNNLARQNALTSVAGNQSDITMATQARDAAADIQTKNLFANNNNKVDISSIQQMIDDVRKTSGGDGLAVSHAADFAQDRLDSLTSTSPDNVYDSFRKDIAGALNGTLKLDKYANAGFAKKQLASIRDAADDAIEDVAPGFQNYMQQYADASKKIDQMQTLQNIQNSATGNTPDIRSQVGVLSQPKWSNMVNEATLPDLQKLLTPQQLDVLQNVTADLDRGSSATNLQLKAGGSPTTQNFSMAQSLGAQLAGKAVGSLVPGGNFIVDGLNAVGGKNSAKVMQFITQAATDPAIALQLMQKASAKSQNGLASMLYQKLLSPVGQAIFTPLERMQILQKLPRNIASMVSSQAIQSQAGINQNNPLPQNPSSNAIIPQGATQ